MIGIDWRLVRYAAGLCLPTAAVVALGVYLYVDKVPAIVRAERGRVREIYRETAVAIRQKPADFRRTALPKEWKPCGQMKPGKWGFLPDVPEGLVRVWYDHGDGTASFTTVGCVPETDYQTWFAVVESVFLLVLVGVTVVGIRFFVGYMKSRDDFLAATAHDLTTPLVGMRMLIGRNDEDARKLNERMILIVDNIRQFLKLGGRRTAPNPRPCDVVAKCREAYSLFAADYEDSEGGPVEIVASDTGDRTPVCRADETMLMQILWNLFGNDLKYAAPYGRVAVRVKAGDGSVAVEFADEGQGMTPRQMRHAFDRYYRAKTVLESGKGGFGIGLCTAREFARAMGGDLTVRPNEPKGCVFALTLPRVVGK